MSSCLLKFLGVRSSPMSSSFGVKPPASGFQSYSYHSLKTSHPYSTDDKTSRLMVKQFSTARDTQKVSQSYMEKIIGRRETEVTRRRSGEGNGIPLQYSCLENPMFRGAWWAAVHGVAESQTRLSDFTFTFHFHALEKGMATHSSILAWRIPGTADPSGLPSMGSHRFGHD